MPIRNPYAYFNASRRPHVNEREVDRLDRRINRRVFDVQNYVYAVYNQWDEVFAICGSMDVARLMLATNNSRDRWGEQGRIEKFKVLYQDHFFD